MSPSVAAFLCVGFMLYLLWSDLRTTKHVSAGIWIPLIWMFFAGSRYLSNWLSLGAPVGNPDDYLEGSALDRNIFTALIVVGLALLHWRRVKWTRVLAENKWIWLFFLWGAVSVFWSDYPFVSFKRLIKASGNVVMALVVLTEKRPYEAVGTLIRRFAILCVPLSMLFVKYYPDLGRSYNPWTYEPMFTGVAQQKNGLGQICLLSGIYFSWALIRAGQAYQRPPLYVTAIFLWMIGWLLSMSDSATSLTCLLLGVTLLLASHMPLIRREPRRLLAVGIGGACLFGILETTIDLSATVIAMLGRDPSLTTRVPMWNDLIQMVGNPLTGSGYESFWLGGNLSLIWVRYGFLHQAHNGYLETYLNVGLVGLLLLLAAIVTGLFKVHRHLRSEHASGMLRLCFVIIVIVYNWTEATFVGVSNTWLVFLLGAINVPETKVSPSASGVSISPSGPVTSKHKYSTRGGQ